MNRLLNGAAGPVVQINILLPMKTGTLSTRKRVPVFSLKNLETWRCIPTFPAYF